MVLRVLQASCLQGLERRGFVLALTGSRLLGGGRVTTAAGVPPWRGLKGQANLTKIQEAAGQRLTPARLVVTHSSYMDGLISLLGRFVTDPDAMNNVSSVIPGRIYVVKGRSELFKMTVRDTTNGFKALVRKGTLGQEVFISTTKMNLEEVKAALNRAAGFDLEKGGSRREQKAGRKRR